MATKRKVKKKSSEAVKQSSVQAPGRVAGIRIREREPSAPGRKGATKSDARAARAGSKTKTSVRSAASKPRRKKAKASKAGPQKMKAYASFDDCLADQPAPQQKLIRALRRFVARTAPALVEAVKWGSGCWLSGRAAIVYVFAAADHVQFGFLNGVRIDDPRGLLAGSGKYVRYVRVRDLRDIDERAFKAFVRQAIDLGHPAFVK